MAPATDLPANLTRRDFRRDLHAEISSDRAIYAVGAAYCLLATALAAALPGRQYLDVLIYAPTWVGLALPGLFLFICARALPDVIRERPASPVAALVARMSEFVTPRAVAGLLLIALQVVLTGAFTSVKNMLPEMSAYVWDLRLADIDAMLHGGTDPWRFLSALVSQPQLLHALEFVYASVWMMMIGLVPAIVALSPAMAPIRQRFFVTYILCWALLGNVLAGIFLSAGPVYYGEFTGDFDRFGPLLDHIAANSGALWSAADIQRSLWLAYKNDMVALGSGISAFPSVHLSMVTLWTIVAFQKNVRLGFAALTFLLVILVGSVALGWHYAIDGYASIIVTLLLWTILGRLPSGARTSFEKS